MIRLMHTDPKLDAHPEVREYLERVSKVINDNVDILTFRNHLVMFGSVTIELQPNASNCQIDLANPPRVCVMSEK